MVLDIFLKFEKKAHQAMRIILNGIRKRANNLWVVLIKRLVHARHVIMRFLTIESLRNNEVRYLMIKLNSKVTTNFNETKLIFCLTKFQIC